MGPERKTESAFYDWCRQELGLKARKLKDQREQGFPDRSIILPGARLICIEFKSPDGSLDPAQVRRIAELEELQVPVLVTSSLKEAKEWTLQQVARNKRRKS